MSGLERRTLRRVAPFLVGNVLFGTGLIFHAFLYNFYLEALHLSPETMGHAAAALAGGGLVILLPAGAFTDRAGARAAITAAATFAAGGLALGALAATPLSVYAAAAVAGAGSGMWRVATPPILMGLTDQWSRARVFAWNVGLLVAWGGLGTALAGTTAHWLEGPGRLEHLAAVRSALLLGAGVSAVSLVLFHAARLPAIAPPSTTPADRSRATLSPPLLRRALLPRVGSVAAWMLGPALVAPFLNIFFAHQHRLAIERIGVVFAIGNVLWALAVFASGEVASRLGVHRLLIAAVLGFAPAIWGLSLAGTVQLAIVLYFLQGVIAPVTNPLIDQWLLGQTPREHHGVVSSWRQVAADASAMIGASLGGMLLTRTGYRPLLAGAGAVGLAGALGLIAALQRSPRPRPAKIGDP